MPVPSPEELAEFIDDPLAHKLASQARIYWRKKRRNRNLLTVLFVIFIPATCATTLWFGTDGAGANFEPMAAAGVPFAMALLFGVVYAALWVRLVAEELPFEYEPDMVAPVVHYIDPRIAYRPKNGLAQSDFEKSQFIPEEVGEFSSRRCFDGSIRSLKLRFGQLEASSARRRGWRKKPDFSFRGLFAVAQFERGFPGYTAIYPTGDQQWTWWDPAVAPDGAQALELNLSGLAAISTDPEAASELLTPPVVERLNTLQEAFSDDASTTESPAFCLVLSNDGCFFAHPHRAYFERPASLAIKDTAHLHRVGRQISALVGVIERL